MTLSKVVRALTLLLLAPSLSIPQNAPSVSPTASAGKSFVPPFYWDKSSDVNKWLKDHEPFLQRGDGCMLNMSFADSTSRSGLNNVALFMIAPGDPDNFEENSTVIHDSRSGLDVRVGARYVYGEGIEELEIALGFEGDADNVFNEVTAAQARSLRDKNWKALTLVRKTQIGDTRYEYSLNCENGKTFMSVLRKPVGRRRHSS
jgi:hypothetical protein